MSTKTNFKRIALVAAAALGLGVLSSVPSQATVGGPTVTVTAGTGTTISSDSSTAALATVAFLKGAAADSVTVSGVVKSVPAGQAATNMVLMFVDSTTGYTATTGVYKGGAVSGGFAAPRDTTVTGSFNVTANASDSITSTARYASANFKVVLDTNVSGQGGAASSLIAGTYIYTIIATPYNAGVVGTAVLTDVSIVIASATNTSLVASAVYSTAVLSAGTADAGSTTDSTVVAVSTASTTAAAVILVTLQNSSASTNARESVTVTTNIGSVGNGTIFGRSVVLPYTGAMTVGIRPDGTAGEATITISTPSVTFASKKVTFYSTTVTKIVGTKLLNTLTTGSNSGVILGVATDANSIANAADDSVYAYSSDTTIVSNYGSACAYSASSKGQVCSLTGVKAGTVNITLRDAATVALSTVASATVSVTVNISPIATVKLAFDKATYAANEKAYITLTAYDAAGKVVPAISSQALLSSTGITSTTGFGNGSDTDLVSRYATVTTANRATTAPLSTEPIAVWTVYMPANGGTVTINAKGGSYLPLAGQVAISASATVTDNAAAALAAVTALATTVASLKTLITTLTNLVLKIQKKVKA